MTALDLRIKFKMDTGYYPVWSSENKVSEFGGWLKVGDQSIFRSGDTPFSNDERLKTIYGLWLEEMFFERKIRDIYHMDTGHVAAYKSRTVMLSNVYIKWLEDRVIQNQMQLKS